jgi:hypothetical protein
LNPDWSYLNFTSMCCILIGAISILPQCVES